jgi:capsular polysaccharide biosynthesis protein
VEAAYPGVRFVGLGKDERAEIRRYLWLHEMSDNVEWLTVTAERAARLGAVMRGYYDQPSPRGGERMFFSRGAEKARRLTNEAELEAIAARHGFTRFEAVSGNHPEQVRRFANADAIIAVHGAGLTNLIFAQPGTAVMELFPRDCVKSTYLWLSNRLDLRHYPLLGSDGDYSQAFAVDSRHFEAKLGEMLAASAPDASSAA